MGNLTIRNFDDSVVETLKTQTKANQRSLGAEVRYVLPRGKYALRYQYKTPLLRVVLALALSLPLLSQIVRATTVIEQSFSSLVHDAEVIAIGTVTAIETEWDTQKKAPFTLVTFSDLEVLKGEAGQTELTLHFLGGPTPDGLIMQIAGVPQFSMGERNVVFSVGNQYQAVPLVGMWQGVYRVVFDAEREVETIYNHASQPVTTLPTEEGGILHDEAPIVSFDPAQDRQEHKGSRPEAMSLETFTQRIEQELQNEQ